MDENTILDQDFQPTHGRHPIEAIVWWEEKRMYYNLILIGWEVCMMVSYAEGTIRYGIENAIWDSLYFTIAANLFYTFGWMVELLIHHYSKGYTFHKTLRVLILTFGTAFSLFLTYVLYEAALFIGNLGH
ncbi:MAG: hypothetical protein AAFV25_15635 [Bacteroidota bacterium]